MGQTIENTILKTLEDAAPPILSRNEIERITGGAVKAKTLANIDSVGVDCIEDRFTIGRKVCYPTPAVISWLSKRLTVAKIKDGAA